MPPRLRLQRIDCIVGARPNFIKIAPIMRALNRDQRFSTRLIHTGQHYDVSMNAVFFEELQIPSPDLNLEVGSSTGTEQTARIMTGLERAFLANRPDLVLVVGDVNSTLAAALVAAKLLIPLAHVEAGLRSHDRTMPEEINRLVTDRLSDLLLTTEREAAANLRREGVSAERIVFVGNVMIDSLRASMPRARNAFATMAEHGADDAFLDAARGGFGFVTLHRPSNVDDPSHLGRLLKTLASVSVDLPLVFAMHPRTKATVTAHGFAALINTPNLLVTPPLPYLQTIGLMREAKVAITDSGGMQEETTALGIPCLTLRDNTERPITVTEGTNTVIGTAPEALITAVREVMRTGGKRGRVPEMWDGRAAERVVRAILAS